MQINRLVEDPVDPVDIAHYLKAKLVAIALKQMKFYPQT